MRTKKINGTLSIISANEIGSSTGLSVIDLPLSEDQPNTLQITSTSILAHVKLPADSLTQPVLLSGQSYAKFGSTWKPTYTPTLGSANVLTSVPTSPTPVSESTNDSCSSVDMNELLPDPTGDDSGHEWVELHNLTDQTVLLNGCVLNISGTQYPFAPDDMLEPKEFRIFLQISDGSNLRTLSLKNSGQSIISFGHKVNNSFQPIQTVQYQDALENQSWARFEAGWRWTAPDATNDGTLLPTEFPAPDSTAPAAPLVGTGDPTSAPATQANVQITELLPNPAAPATDDQDEFVELYNSGETAVNLKDYQVQTGSNYTHSYTFDTSSLGSHEYMTLTSGKTTLSLANGGGRARLQKPDGTTINGTDPYTDAPEGASWALIDGTWRWTTTPTSGTANVMTAAVPPVAQAATSNTKLSTKSPRSSISTAKPKATTTSSKLPKAKTISTPKTKAASTAAGAARNGNDATSPSNLHPIIIAGVGSLAVGYAIYEYRHDLANRIYQLRRYRAARRAARTAYAGR